MPRLAQKQKYWCNLSTDNPVDYFKIYNFILFIDSITQQLYHCFNNHKEIISDFQVLTNPCANGDLCHF